MTPEEKATAYETLKNAGPGHVFLSESGEELYFIIPFSTGDVLLRLVGEDFRSMTDAERKRRVQNALLDLMNGK